MLYLLLALIGGAMIPFQAGINAQLAQLVNGPIRAALVSFLVGTVVLLVAVATMPRPLPSMSKLGGARLPGRVAGVVCLFGGVLLIRIF